jgi:hypothetical protein
LLQDNLLEDINGNSDYQVLDPLGPAPLNTPGGLVDFTIDHNTSRFAGLSCISMDGSTVAANLAQNFTFQNNIMERGMYGVHGSGTGEGSAALNTFCAPNYLFTHNAIVGYPAAAPSYPSNNWFPASLDNVGFVNYSADDYHLATTSAYKGMGTDGKDIGADIDALNAATTCAVSGGCTCGGLPPLPDGGPIDLADMGQDGGMAPDDLAQPATPFSQPAGGVGTGQSGCSCSFARRDTSSLPLPLILALGLLLACRPQRRKDS